MIKNVVLDIGQVLIKFDWKAFLRELFPNDIADSVYEATWESPIWREFDLSNKPVDEIVGEFIKSAPMYEVQIQTAIKRMGECAQKQDYAINLVKKIKSCGLKVFYLSNYSEYLINANKSVLDFIPFMDGGLFSYEVHCVKPDPLIYKCLCERYCINPWDSVFVDDNISNIKAASEMGFKTVLFKGEESIASVFELSGISMA